MRKLISASLLFAMYVGTIAPLMHPTNAQVIGTAYLTKMKEVPEGLKFRLSEGSEGVGSREVQLPASTETLSTGDSASLLNRLPAIKQEENDEIDFAKRTGTLPPPKRGKQIPVKFPSDEGRGTPKLNPGTTLNVIRYSPEGDVSLAPDLSVTFSEPMVAISSPEHAASYAPIEISPSVEGRWRWLGTKTLMFDTSKRFPMATKFRVRIPAGTKAINGQTLQNETAWTFSTPPPKVLQKLPEGQTVRRDSLIFVSFDQEIDPAAVLKAISVTGQGKAIPIRLATDEEINADPSVAYYAKQSQPRRWAAFRAINTEGMTENALPANTTITVTIEKGTPSAEGPLTTTAPQSFSFRTYGPFESRGGFCGWRDNRNCSPFEQWYLEFNNPIDSSKFTKELVRIEPAIEGVKIYPAGNYIYIEGYKKGNTTYKVTVDPLLKDNFGQSLGKPAQAIIKVGAAAQNLYAQGGTMAVLDPTAKPVYSVYSTNHRSVKVRMYQVQPSDWNQFQQYVRRLNYDDGDRPAIPGRLISEKTISIQNKPDEQVETRIDISPALSGGYGNVIVDIEPIVKRDKYDRSRIFTWVQVTQIGLDAFVDSQELIGWATDLKTGRPLSGVELSIYPNGGSVIGRQASDATEPGVFDQAWDWLMGWGSAYGNSAESMGSNGSYAPTESIEPAQTNLTGPSGVLRLSLPDKQSEDGSNLLIAKRGNDMAFLPENSDYYWSDSGNWYQKPQIDSLRWFVFDDRKMYRPNEEVAVKGYIRKISAGKLGDVAGVADSARGLIWSVKDGQNNEIAKGTGELNAFGAFNLKFKLPDNMNLGYGRIELSTTSPVAGSSFIHQFQIQEFRRPEFEVSTTVNSEAPHFVGEAADISVEAKYYAGGGLANAETNWTVTAVPTNYTPPNRGDFTFGTWVPWWRIYDYKISRRGRGYGGGITQTFKGVTDASGKHRLKIDFESVSPARPYSVTASAAVQDVNRQTWSSSANLLVHPSSLYVGIRTPRTFVQKGEKIVVESIVSDIDGKLVPGRDVEVKAVLKDWEFENGSWKEKIVDEQYCTARSDVTAQECSFIAKQGGRYTITATVMDDRERFNQSEFTIWVPGGKTLPQRNVEQEEVQIIPSKKEFAPGEVAELLVIAPWPGAEGVLTLRRDGIVKTERFSIVESATTLKVPLDESYLPNIHAQVDLVGAAIRTDDKGEPAANLAKRPAFASASINLAISTAARTLSVTANPQDMTLSPGGTTTVDVEVKDSRGEPVGNVEVAVVVVDESVLALTGYSVSDPIHVFYTDRSAGTTDHHSRKDILLGNPEDVQPPPPPPPPPSPVATGSAEMQMAKAPGIATRRSKADAESKSSDANTSAGVDDAIDVRQDFNALAVFAPSVRTDSSGKAVVDVKLPDNLTRYRITAVAVDSEKRFGKTESNITAKQPLMVRPSAPRFMNFGDKIELPVVVQNQTDQEMTVNVAVRATNAELTGGIGKSVVVKANGREEIRFPVSAAKAGTARFQIGASSGKYSDAAEISLPVWTPATTEAFATYGTTDENGAILQPIQSPGEVYPQFGGLELTTSSTQLQELTDSFIYLYRYPFECSEQVASRMISIAALRDVLTAFKAKEMPSDAEIKSSFEKDIKILQSRQRSDGSFGMWKRDRERYEYPFLTVHVAHSLALAKAKGYNVPDEMLNRTKPFLKEIEKHFNDEWHKRSPQARWTISAYALYVRDIMGDKDAAKAKALLAEATIEKMPFEALGWALSVLANDAGSESEAASIKRYLMNRTTETAAHANFVTDYDDGGWLIMQSNRRADGVLLEALIKAEPGNDLIPKLVRGLLDNRNKGHWGSTQENVFILLALDKYFNAFEKVTPHFVTRVWLGSAYAGEQEFKGRSIDSNLLSIPMSYLIDQNGASNLIVDKQGSGRLYYRIGMKYAPVNLKLASADNGFTILRKYEAIDSPEDVVQNADGSWKIKSGARVRVRLTMVAQARRYHVALLDNLPAGLEILNPGLAVTEAMPADTGGGNTGVAEFGSRSYGSSWWWGQNWFEHQNFRDERAEAFASLLWEGVYNYSYVTRATTPGEFIVPPAKAEEMYHPETFGRTGTDFVSIK